MPQTVFVAGGTGGVGQHVVRKLLARGDAVRLLVRDAVRAREQVGEAPQLVIGDIRTPETYSKALQGADYVICTIGAQVSQGGVPQEVDYQGVRDMAYAAVAAGVQQYVLVSSIGVTRANHPLNARFSDVMAWKLKGEDALRGCGIGYTIVRPGGLVDEVGGVKALRFAQGDAITGRTSREDVAEVCVQALTEINARNVTLEAIETEGPPPSDWAALFGELDAGK